MATQEELLERIWAEAINGAMNEARIDRQIRQAKVNPAGPFADVGGTCERCARGIS